MARGDRHGHGIDCLLETPRGVLPIEIKSGETIRSSTFKGLEYWSRLTGYEPGAGILIHGGMEEQSRENGHGVGATGLSGFLRSLSGST